MLYGYARVSTDEQDTAAQVAALKTAGCEIIITETGSGSKRREKLDKLLKRLGHGDVLYVWKLDRLSRSLKDVLAIMEELDRQGAGFKSITEAHFDTTSATGALMLQIVASFAEFERKMLRERTFAGLKAARARGARLGRPQALTQEQQRQMTEMLANGSTMADCARTFNVHRATIKRLVEALKLIPTRVRKNDYAVPKEAA